ncbi:superinfection immunity protein [Polluticoccus soli]|uniref:superinfection immunity protein n=1 Tax=Polluticoccus soli TaxID=3034150 RepID=UPI0023E14EEB|nr:superinfection immunity protein [Flavipsychrobacter sp. JY13-12]
MLITILIIAVAVIIYFTPAITAIANGKRNSTSIFILNLFLGWTFVGWVVALIWAHTYEKS